MNRFRSRDVLLCAAFGLSKATPTSAGKPNVGNQSPHVGFLYLHGGFYGPLHDWKTGSTGGDRHHGCGSYPDTGDGHLHGSEDHDQRPAFLPADGRDTAACGHDQLLQRQTNFQTSHAGREMSNHWTRSGVAWVRLNFLQIGLWLDICGCSPSDVNP